MQRQLLPLGYFLDSRSVPGETSFAEVGAAVLVFTSCSADLGIELRTAFLAGEKCGKLLVAESAAIGSEPAELSSRLIEDPENFLLDQRRRLLYEHLQRLQDLAIRGGVVLSFEGADEAADALDPPGS